MILVPQICFSQLTTHHVMRALNGSTFDVRTSMPNIANGQILVGNASGVGTAVTMSGDATLSNTGALSLNPASAGYSKWTTTGANIYRSSLVGIGQTSPTFDLDVRGIKGIKLTTAAFGSVPDPGSVANDFVSLTPRGFDLTMDAQNISAPFTPPSLGIAVAVSRPQPAMVLKNAGSGAALLIADGEVGILNASPVYPLDVTGDINSSVGYKVGGSAIAGKYLRANGTRFVAADLAAADIIQAGATTGQVLTWSGSVWAAATLSPQSFTDAAAANNTIFYSTDRSKLCYKDPGGTVNELY